MRDSIEIIEEFHTAGLISDDFVEKLASEIHQHVLIKEAFGEELGSALGAAGQMFSSMFPNATHTVKGWLGLNPSLGQRIAGGLGSLMEHPLGQHMVIGGALGGAQMIKNVLTKAMDNMTMNSSYAQMMQQFPDLQKADPSLVHRTFQVVQQYAPSVAKNPTVSGTFVKGILQYPDAAVTPEHVRSLVDVERQLSSMDQPGLLGEMATGAARSLGQSAVHTFAPDPLRVKELKLREEADARRANMENWQKAQMAMNMLGTGVNTVGGGVNIAKGVRDLKEPGRGDQMEMQQSQHEDKMQQADRFHKERQDTEAMKLLMQQRRNATPKGFPLESLRPATDAFKMEHGQDPKDLDDLMDWIKFQQEQGRLRPGRR